MDKTVMIITCIIFVGVLLVSLPVLFVWINGVIVGSYEGFPQEDDIAIKRMIYIILTFATIAADVLVSILLVKLVKTIRKKL